MKLLFSATPAFGHVLPLAPLMQAAVDAGHTVGLLSSAGFRGEATAELPVEVEFLDAGVMPGEFSEEAARRTGADVFHPTPQVIGEIFGGARVDLAITDSIDQAADWGADLIVAEPFDAVGPIVAAGLGIDWHRAGIGPALPSAITDEIDRVASARSERANLRPVAASSYIDPCPPQLQDPDWIPATTVRPVRPQAHRRPKDITLDLPDFAARDKPTVLVTFGTIFSDPDILAAAVAAVMDTEVNVIATLGSSLRHSASDQASQERLTGAAPARVRYVPFVPLAQLLDEVDLVVGAGGVGTVLGTLAHGLPMVLWPQGADQPINAARAAASGTSITADSSAEISTAVTEVLRNNAFRNQARSIAAEIADRPHPATVIAEITNA
ncbi:glycosyltransferase [Nocardia sp. NEAU-G5]|uniref:Glycosyltransferase n=1 Tax=Nocardia albiluteola TaxID=2842303 RepID=A0ABS6B7N9_9NOCA|nr:glycosyltransferase [Nocardia albiluteola]MBU3065411.1 glycosyltransferase [Nocardia albiluteola]